MSKNQMLINYVPGVECRVAVVREGRLEELHSERMDAVSHVGNIYVGRVVNVEPAIQAAFVDFGLEENGFLHVTDVHPRYFPGEDEETKELVGKKTPRRERPPIQACLKRGQEVIVQVLKEGIGVKGPTLTSYLSVPGRFLVMMPFMDKVGVSRRVEDEDQRREMRAVLDQLDLPDGFGFILRTAGMEETKTSLKRDLAYLQRLWKDMQRRLAQGNKPRLLYAESDLLMRCLRDVLTGEVDEVVVDEAGAIRRAARFLKIVSPRGGPRLLRHVDATPLFHAFGVEPQIRQMHEREVPLPSGGGLVIDEAEALVAIDVNSGRMRDNRDAETTAYKTNCEAVDEICRQLRLRDLGGVIILDLIDMRSKKHQRDIEQRIRDNLKRDRAHSKTLPISQFGIVEMTRQRMRGSHRTQHFAPCPSCAGRGLLQRPASAMGEALRELGWVLHQPRVHKAEMAVAARLAGELLSTGRQRLARLERLTGKHVDVRISESAPLDRVTFYAYDDRGADIDVDKLPAPAMPKNLEVWAEPVGAEDDWTSDPSEEAAALVRAEVEAEAAVAAQMEAHDAAAAESEDMGPDELEEGGFEPLDHVAATGKKKRRRRRRGGRGDDDAPAPQPEPRRLQPAPQPRPAAEPHAEGGEGGEGGGKKRRRRRRRRGKGGGENGQASGFGEPHTVEAADTGAPPTGSGLRGDSWDLEPVHVPALRGTAQPAPRPAPAVDQDLGDDQTDGSHGSAGAPDGQGEGGGKKRRRRRRRRGKGGGANGEQAPQGGAHGDEHDEPDGAAGMVEEPVREPREIVSAQEPEAAPQDAEGEPGEVGEVVVKKKRRRRGGRGRKKAGATTEAPSAEPDASDD
ncbi:MAG: Rne/Rng family ribonuclease [Phycisphaerales bacterium]|nr:Rne/Rng family ribonuclease [Phycisphaerales bacterium]